MQFLQFKKYVQEDCRSCVSINGARGSFACWLLLGDNTSLSHKKTWPPNRFSVYRLFPTPLFYVYVNQ